LIYIERAGELKEIAAVVVVVVVVVVVGKGNE